MKKWNVVLSNVLNKYNQKSTATAVLLFFLFILFMQAKCQEKQKQCYKVHKLQQAQKWQGKLCKVCLLLGCAVCQAKGFAKQRPKKNQACLSQRQLCQNHPCVQTVELILSQQQAQNLPKNPSVFSARKGQLCQTEQVSQHLLFVRQYTAKAKQVLHKKSAVFCLGQCRTQTTLQPT